MLQAEMIMIECPPKIRKEDFDKALRLSSNAAVAAAVDEIGYSNTGPMSNTEPLRPMFPRRSCGHA